MVGVLGLATKSPEAASLVESRYPYFEELGAYAGASFGAKARDFEDRAREREDVRRIIDQREFWPVFQPIVDLRTGDTLGYEALSRFRDGRPPDQVFDAAARFGLRSELEGTCAAAAFAASVTLPEGAFLNVNFSPTALTEGWARDTIADARRAGLTRDLVLEITEHADVHDYGALRRAVAECQGCRLAVDDTGTGTATLHHIVALRPEFVKIDISLVRHVDVSPDKQAMIAGLCYYAAQSGATIVAEGVETVGEATALRGPSEGLGEHRMLAQGYFFGRPAPAPDPTS
jgi:EAL domain-containing protein (putative c-di-GMP-specific phosphodiesterase class I)